MRRYGYVGERNGRKPYTQLIFKSKLTENQIKNIKLQEEELSEYRFVATADLVKFVDTPRIQALVAFFDGKIDNAIAYLENEIVVC